MTEQKETGRKEIPVVKIKTREKETCRKIRGITVKVAAVAYPMPKHIVLHIKLKDGSEKVARAHLVSMYNNYAYYFLYASYVEELMPVFNQIQEVKAYEEQ
jgi:desulfoferrodoxin (superoxide reductase-like protein)